MTQGQQNAEMRMEHSAYLDPGVLIESKDPAVIAFALEQAGDGDDIIRAVRLYYAVRDQIIYDPYLPLGRRESYSAKEALAMGRGWCVSKVALLTACCRAVGIPARPGYADVVNHLATEKLIENMGSDVFAWHSYAEIWLDDAWVKATPTFNSSLCDKFGLNPLEFDGRADSLFHEYDRAGNRHMEYIRHRGHFSDVPIDQILQTFYGLYKSVFLGIEGDFQAEAGTPTSV